MPAEIGTLQQISIILEKQNGVSSINGHTYYIGQTVLRRNLIVIMFVLQYIRVCVQVTEA